MTQEELLKKILVEVVDTKETVREMRELMFTKEVAQEMESRLMTHIDGFIKLHQTLVLELAAMRSKNDRLEERLKKVEMKLGITVEA